MQKNFNAHAVAWRSSNTDARGGLTIDWAAELSLVLLNRGWVNTFVEARKEFIVNIT